ncbi:hypothetical protein [Planococcus lenghuensis]|uniref:Uncharacterized protein n=1 Tax=Planococcus lenghuensis TaxID=2213202 RepID=A0A1Q2KWN4_9BACL|nr:hypothetical protein [Planococcus lenghuensis]AQQ52601.1 hypothetical protein B0X71_05485 [Planococcus lenghuensis]
MARLILACLVIVSIAAAWLGYSRLTDDTYEGMSIIPEEHEDIPLYEGLEPQEHQYTLQGNEWQEVRGFYLDTFPGLGWRLVHEESALDDPDVSNDSSGFMTRWRKDGFDGELWISGGYNQFDDKTEIIFDQTQIRTQSVWLEEAPDSICIYQTEEDDHCSRTEDPDIIRVLTDFVNAGNDWEDAADLSEELAVIDFGTLEVKVAQPEGGDVFLQSTEGVKTMKPEPEFLKLLEYVVEHN